jgi:uncharacterized membrane protein YphA (DoxX/SURF4 family)
MANERKSDLGTIYVPLRLTYGLVPVVAGLDKFFNLLTNWEAYLPSFASSLLPVSPTVFMQIVGGIEIIAGLAVLNGLTRLGANVVMAWLVLIAAAVSMAGYYDIAVRDLVMAMGAYALGQAARLRGEQWIPAAIVMEERVHAQSK